MIKMEIKNILKEFTERCSKRLDLFSIIQFGSSTYSNYFKDIDIVLFSKDLVFSTKDILLLKDIVKSFQLKYKNLAFDISGGVEMSKKVKYNITIVPLQKIDLVFNVDPFFLKNLQEDKNKVILFGRDPFKKKINVNKIEIIRKLDIERNHFIRHFFEDESIKERKSLIYYFFKTVLRLMLFDKFGLEKDRLLNMFIERYPKIELPKNFRDIIKNKIRQYDYLGLLRFSEDCLSFLSRE